MPARPVPGGAAPVCFGCCGPGTRGGPGHFPGKIPGDDGMSRGHSLDSENCHDVITWNTLELGSSREDFAQVAVICDALVKRHRLLDNVA